MTTVYLTHEVCAKHEMGAAHPESPARLGAIHDTLGRRGLLDLLHSVDAPSVDTAHLARAHGSAYVDQIIAASPSDGRVQLDPDTSMNSFSLDASFRAAGAGIEATRMVAAGEADNAFCAVRPPGHHAERARSMGFCLFGSVAAAALYATEELGMDRVAIVDFDVHHGNGTEDIVHDNPSVLFCSTFQHPYYPGYYRPSVSGQLENVPLPAGTGSDGFREAITERWLPELEAFKPEMLFISAGFDAHQEDPLASLALQDQDYAWVTSVLMDIADRHSQGKLVSMLEGGYALDALGRSAAEHVAVLAG